MDKPDLEPGNMVLIGVLVEGALAAFALALGWLFGYDPLAGLDWTWAGAGWGLAATLPPVVLMIACSRSTLAPFRSLMRLMHKLLLPHFDGCTVVDLGLISISAGVGEELLFRGFLQGVIGEYSHPWVGLAVASLVFGLAHFITPMYALFAMLLGLYLGGLWLWCDNLLAPLVTHAAYDLAMLLYLTGPGRAERETRRGGEGETETDETGESKAESKEDASAACGVDTTPSDTIHPLAV